MRLAHPRVLDASALVALFESHPTMVAFLDEAHAGRWNLLLPTTCIADASSQLGAHESAWEAILLTGGVIPLPLTVAAAIQIGTWPGPLQVRHAAFEASATRAVVLTAEPHLYDRLLVATQTLD